MRLKNGMSIEEIKNELIDNSIKVDEERQLQYNLRYNNNLIKNDNISTIIKNKNIVLSKKMLDYYLENSLKKEEIQIDLNNIPSLSERKYLINSKKRIEKLYVNIISTDNNIQNYCIDMIYFPNIIYSNTVAIGQQNSWFYLFLFEDDKAIVFNEKDLTEIKEIKITFEWRDLSNDN